MNGVRFATAREVFEAFPSVAQDMGAPPTDDAPANFARALARGATPEDAVVFCAYLLPRREAVWWGCQTVKALGGARDEAEAAALAAAEAWVREPEDARRRAAMTAGESGDRALPGTWIALAAAWSGGSLNAGEQPVPCPPHLTAKATRVAVLTALARVPARERADQIRACVEGALRLLGQAEAKAS